jgi:drug/metabolite transporter (DMT)-like permease
MSNNELLGLGALAVACLFAAAILFRSWRRRGTRQPLVAAIAVLVLGACAVALALLGAPYRIVVGSAFIVAMLVVLFSARHERGRS